MAPIGCDLHGFMSLLLSWNIANSSLQVLQFKILYLTIQFNFNSLNINSHSVVVHCIKYGVCFCFLCVSENLFIEFQDFTSSWTFFAISLSSIIFETLFKTDFFCYFSRYENKFAQCQQRENKVNESVHMFVIKECISLVYSSLLLALPSRTHFSVYEWYAENYAIQNIP